MVLRIKKEARMSGLSLEGVLWGIANAALALVMWGSQVSPRQVRSNASEWAIACGVRNPPNWLKTRRADSLIFHGAAILLVLSAVTGALLFMNVGAIQLGPKLLFVVGCASIITAIIWHLFAQPVVDHAPTVVSRPDAIPSQPAMAEAGILLECHIAPRPPVLPPNGRMYVLKTFPIPQQQGGGGLMEQFFGETSPSEWLPKRAGGLPHFIYSCKLTNYRAEPVFQIQIMIRLTFSESIRDAEGKQTQSGKVEIDRTWPIEVAKLEPGAGNSFEFFIRNDNDKWVEVRFPNVVSARTASGIGREIPLIQQTASGVRLHLVPYLEGKD
jgi:hypothetical protein